jgi:hypothetical protein
LPAPFRPDDDVGDGDDPGYDAEDDESNWAVLESSFSEDPPEERALEVTDVEVAKRRSLEPPRARARELPTEQLTWSGLVERMTAQRESDAARQRTLTRRMYARHHRRPYSLQSGQHLGLRLSLAKIKTQRKRTASQQAETLAPLMAEAVLARHQEDVLRVRDATRRGDDATARHLDGVY